MATYIKHCEYETNRGYDPHDNQCRDCSNRDPCRLATAKRLLAIHARLIDEEPNYREWADYENDARSDEWLDGWRESIRTEALQFIHSRNDPEKLHPNTRIYFQKVIPEWRDYEEQIDIDNLRTAMKSFYDQERRKVLIHPPEGIDYSETEFIDPYDEESDEWQEQVLDEINEQLISQNNWRGFPFDDLFIQDNSIPRRIIQRFVRDFFQYRNREKETAKRWGFLGSRTEGDRWPMKWMLNDTTIKNFIESPNGKVFIEIMKWMEIHRLKMYEGESIAKKLGHGGKKYVVIQPERSDLAAWLSKRKELQNIKISGLKVHKFLKWMADHGLIVQIGKPKRNEPTAYAIGKWGSWTDPETGESKPGRIIFFVQNRNKKKLVQAIRNGVWN